MTRLILWLYLHTWRKLLSLIVDAYYEVFYCDVKTMMLDYFFSALRIIDSPEFLATWVSARLDYEPDPLGGLLDIDRPWWMVWFRHKDDCDGWAELYKTMARAKGWKAYKLFVWAKPLKESHCVCIIKKDDFWYYFDNFGYHSEAHNNIDHIARRAASPGKLVAWRVEK